MQSHAKRLSEVTIANTGAQWLEAPLSYQSALIIQSELVLVHTFPCVDIMLEGDFGSEIFVFVKR